MSAISTHSCLSIRTLLNVLRGWRQRYVLVEERATGHIKRHFCAGASHEKARDREDNNSAYNARRPSLTAGNPCLL